MTLEEKAGQLLMPWMLGDFAPAGSEDFERMAEAVRDDGVGGVIVSVGSPSEVAAKINNLQSLAKYPLLVGADLESGAGYRMRGAVFLPNDIELGGATLFPSLMAVGAAGDDSLAWEMGRVTAVEARAVGVHLPFAPVLDVNNNPDNPVIATRSFGEDPAAVARLGSAFVRGLQEHGAIATGKHFPGHGDTGVDSHVDLPVIRVDRERLDRVELRPFRAAVDAGMGAVMSAHVSIPSVTGSGSMPSTLSPAVLSDLLRGEMGFEGLIVTDAMNMAAITRRFGARDAVVRALEAGADIILMPENPPRGARKPGRRGPLWPCQRSAPGPLRSPHPRTEGAHGAGSRTLHGHLRDPSPSRDPGACGAGDGDRRGIHYPPAQQPQPALAARNPHRERPLHHLPRSQQPARRTLF